MEVKRGFYLKFCWRWTHNEGKKMKIISTCSCWSSQRITLTGLFHVATTHLDREPVRYCYIFTKICLWKETCPIEYLFNMCMGITVHLLVLLFIQYCSKCLWLMELWISWLKSTENSPATLTVWKTSSNKTPPPTVCLFVCLLVCLSSVISGELWLITVSH